jgi:hypothetical protein
MPRKTPSRARQRQRPTKGRASRRKHPNAEAPAPAEAIVPRSLDPVDTNAVEPRNHRELAQAIAAECNLVQVGRDLLESSSEKGASVRARMFETLANWQFGPQRQASAPSTGRPAVRIIWDLPCPPHERENSDEEPQ